MARSLEAAWEDRLVGPGRGRHPAIFEAPETTPRERKQLIRALLSEVTLTVDRQARTAALTLCWEGGAITERTVALPLLPLRQAAAALGIARQTVCIRSNEANSSLCTSAADGAAACVSR